MLDEFAARVRLYGQWDDRLRGRTRFFGAAAATNAALSELCSLRFSAQCIGSGAIELLSVIGRQLEQLNVSMAQHLARYPERGMMPGIDLDRSLITLEQTVLERVLQQQIGHAPRSYARAVRQINRLLSGVEQCVWLSDRWPGGYLYRRVLRRVRAELGRRPDFAILADRVGIGEALIRMLRRQEPGRRAGQGIAVASDSR